MTRPSWSTSQRECKQLVQATSKKAIWQILSSMTTWRSRWSNEFNAKLYTTNSCRTRSLQPQEMVFARRKHHDSEANRFRVTSTCHSRATPEVQANQIDPSIITRLCRHLTLHTITNTDLTSTVCSFYKRPIRWSTTRCRERQGHPSLCATQTNSLLMGWTSKLKVYLKA